VAGLRETICAPECTIASLCRADYPATISEIAPLVPSFCRHFACPAGIEKAEYAIYGFKRGHIPEDQLISGHLPDGEQITGLSFGTPDKPFSRAGWIVNPYTGKIYTPTGKNPGEYYPSAQSATKYLDL
jgi:hypothetical protein